MGTFANSGHGGITVRGLLAILILLPWLSAPQAGELVFGELVVHSVPGQDLRASLPVTLPADLPLAALRVSVADEGSYREQGLARPPLLDSLHLALLAHNGRQARIQIFADTPWQGEGLVLLLHAQYPGHLRMATFPIHPVQAAEQDEYVTVGSNDTLDSVALRLANRHSRSHLHMMYALFLANPEAFYRDNMNNLRSGARLRVPDTEALYRFEDSEVFAAIRDHQARWRAGNEAAPVADPAASARLDLERNRHALLNELQTLAEEEDRFTSQNQALRERLAQLESRVSRFGNELIDLPTDTPAATPSPTPAPLPHEAPRDITPLQEQPAQADTPVAKPAPADPSPELPAWVFLLVMALVVASGVVMQRTLHHKARVST